MISSLPLNWKTRPRDESGSIPGMVFGFHQGHTPIANQSIFLRVLKLPPTMMEQPVVVFAEIFIAPLSPDQLLLVVL